MHNGCLFNKESGSSKRTNCSFRAFCLEKYLSAFKTIEFSRESVYISPLSKEKKLKQEFLLFLFGKLYLIPMCKKRLRHLNTTRQKKTLPLGSVNNYLHSNLSANHPYPEIAAFQFFLLQRPWLPLRKNRAGLLRLRFCSPLGT
jgi:hypothetical protein